MNMLPKRQCQVLQLIRRQGPVSRKEISDQMKLHPNIAGQLVSEMLESGTVREGPSDTLGRGRPRIPLEIDPDRRCMLAATINSTEVSACRINLLGQVTGNVLSKSTRESSFPAAVAADLLRRLDSEATLGIGISVSGFVDPGDSHSLLLSSAVTGDGLTDLTPLYEVVGDRPMVLENTMHALAARWALSQDDPSHEHLLLVSIRDGALGSAILVDGKPSHGGITGCNELGHVRFFVDTEPCYCNHVGCLERICSSGFLHLHGAPPEMTLAQAAANMGPSPIPQMQKLMKYLATGLANAVNFIRPDRIVLASPMVRNRAFTSRLERKIRKQLLSPVSDRLRMDVWPLADDQPLGVLLSWLVLAPIYLDNWPLHATGNSSLSA